MLHRDLGLPMSVMDMAIVSAVLASAGVCCPPPTVLLSTHILLASCYYCYSLKSVCACVCVNMKYQIVVELAF